MFAREDNFAAEDLAVGWKTRVDALATRLMIEGVGPETIDALNSLKVEAEKNNSEATVNVIEALVVMLEKDPTAGSDYLLKTGLSELSESFARNGSPASPVSAPVSLGEDAELVADFLVEAREHLSKIEGQMLELERDPTAMEAIHTVFRAFHTIKGLAGFLDFGMVQALAHEVETLLDLARNEKLTLDSAVVDVVLESGDFLQNELAGIERSLNSGAPLEVTDNRALIAKIRICAKESHPPQPQTTKPELGIDTSTKVAPGEEKPAPTLAAPIEVETTSIIPEPPQAPAVPIEAAPEVEVAEVKSTPVAPPPVVVPTTAPAQRSSEPARETDKRSLDTTSVRVETAKLDHLMDMVGEIVIAQSLIRHNHAISSSTDSRLMGDLSQLARVTAEVQRATMSMRMIPVGQLFQRIERAIRDLSRKAGKQVLLETSGTETDIDKTVAEELADPLMHMVRNSIDHGIELPAERIAAGKTAEARINLSARHQGGQVIIEITDDGRGLNSEKIRRKAEERGLISESIQLTDPEIYQLIFEPGFSTADKITDISGRGVGMDVVRRNVEKLRGRIETQSTFGQGTTFLLKLPLTLAIIDGLVVEVGTDRYIIPLSAVWEIFRPKADALFTVEARDEMILVRGQLMPVVRLYQRLGLNCRSSDPSDGLMVVVESNSRRFCLQVDDLLGKQEIVIKSLGETFKDVSALSGCAVLADGRVGLILDIDGIYRGRQS